MNAIKDFTLKENNEWKKVRKCPNYIAKILICPKNKPKNCPKCPKISGKFVLKSYIDLGTRGVGGLQTPSHSFKIKTKTELKKNITKLW